MAKVVGIMATENFQDTNSLVLGFSTEQLRACRKRFGLDMQDAVPCIHSLTVMHRIMAAAMEA